MAANVETMFYVREKPWHGLGTEVQEAPTSADALALAGLDWEVMQENVYTEGGILVPGYKVNLRSTDAAALGIVSDRYKVVQNEDAFQFTDDLLGEGVTYETAGALQGGRKVWMLARMPHRYIIAGDEIAPYMVVTNSHDGRSGIKVAMTPIRVVCQNTLNLALSNAKRIWTTNTFENRLKARCCELCGNTESDCYEIHHVHKLKDLRGKAWWEIAMIAKRRKTIVVCQECHYKIHNRVLNDQAAMESRIPREG